MVLSSVAQLCLTLCDPMNCSMPSLPVHHQLPEVLVLGKSCNNNNNNHKSEGRYVKE